MAIEVVGDPSAVKRYRKYLHEQGHYTKRFMSHLKNQGHAVRDVPEGFRVFNGGIDKVYGVTKAGRKTKKLDPDKRLFISGVANANVVDRMDERLDPAGIDVENYLKNRVLLLDHYYATSQVIGRVQGLDPQQDGVHFEAYIGDPDKAALTQLQKDTRSLVAQELVQTVSVGFVPHKIKAPEFDGEGRLVEPAVILAWELLELSIVAIPCNQDSVFELKDSYYTSNPRDSKRLTTPKAQVKIEGKDVKEDKESSDIQTLIFDKDQFGKDDALAWAKDNDYKADTVEETDETYRVIQRDSEDFESDTLKSIDLDDGVKAVVGLLKTAAEDTRVMEEKLMELLDEMKLMNTQLASFGDDLKGIKEQGESIRGLMDGYDFEKEMPDEEDEDEKEDAKEDSEGDKEDEEKDGGKGEDADKEDEDEKDKEGKSNELAELKDLIVERDATIEKLSGMMISVLEKSNSANG